MKEEEDIHDKIKKIEADLIEQEHRLIHIVTNFWNREERWPKHDDIRRAASKKAILWRLFCSPSTVVVSGGIIALISMFVLIDQNKIIEEQNIIISEQNANLIKQIRLDTKFELEKNLYSKEYNEHKRYLDIIAYHDFLKEVEEEPLIKGVEISSGEYDSLNFSGCTFLLDIYSRINNSTITDSEFLINPSKGLYGLYHPIIENSLLTDVYFVPKEVEENGRNQKYFSSIENSELNYVALMNWFKESRRRGVYSKNYDDWLPDCLGCTIRINSLDHFYVNKISRSNIYLKHQSALIRPDDFLYQMAFDTIFAESIGGFLLAKGQIYNVVVILKYASELEMNNIKSTSNNEFHFNQTESDTLKVKITDMYYDENVNDTISIFSDKEVVVIMDFQTQYDSIIKRISDQKITMGNKSFICKNGAKFGEVKIN